MWDQGMFSTARIFLAMILGAIGLSYMIYGRKQCRGIALACGVALCVVPYFVSNTIIMLIAGAALMIVPFYFRD